MQPVDVLAIGPHPDDVEMGCGGTVAKLVKMGYVVGILDLTEGELGTRGSREKRALESAKAAKILGVTTRISLDLGDGSVMNNDASRKTVVEMLRNFQPKLVLVNHWFDDHPDHVQSSHLIKDTVYLSRLRRFLSEKPQHRIDQLLFYMTRGEFQPSLIIDITDEFEQKIEAARAFDSQLYNENSSDPETTMSNPEFLKLFEARGRFFGRMIGCTYGEPFFSLHPPQILDPVMLWGKRS